MLSRIWRLTRADLRHMLQNALVWITVFLVVVGVILGHLLGESEIAFSEALYVVDETGEDLRGRLADFLTEEGFTGVELAEGEPAPEEKHHAWLADEEILRERLGGVEVGFGLIISGDADSGYVFRHLMPEVLPETSQRLLAQMSMMSIVEKLGADVGIQAPEVELLPGYTMTGKQPLGRNIIPMFVFGEALILGLWFGALLLVNEKTQRTIDALRVSPARLGEVLTAKALALIIFVVAEALITTVAVWGFFPGLPLVLLSAVLMCLFGTGLAFLLGGFFDSLTGFVLSGAALSMFFSLPVFTLYVTNFPDVRWVPTYPMFRLLREGFFPTGQADVLWTNLGVSALLALGALLLGGMIYRRRLWGVQPGADVRNGGASNA